MQANLDVAIECKAVEQVHADHLAGLEAFDSDFPEEIKERIVVCLETRERKLGNGVWVLPVRSFLSKLWANALSLG